MQRHISEELAIIPLLEPKDKTASAYVSDAFNAGLFHTVSIILTLGAITGDSILTVYGDTTAALATALTTAIPFKYRLGAADFKAATADQLGDATSVLATGLTLTAASFDHRTLIIDIDPNTLPSGKPWVAINLDSTANPMLVAAVAVGVPRYSGHLIPSAI